MSISIKNKIRKRADKLYNKVKPLMGTKKEFIKNYEIIHSIAMGDCGIKKQEYLENHSDKIFRIVYDILMMPREKMTSMNDLQKEFKDLLREKELINNNVPNLLNEKN